MHGRHGLDDRGRKDTRDSIYGVVVDVPSADGQVHDFARAHKDALQGRLVPGSLDAFDCLDDERSGDLIDLSATERSDDVALHAALFVLIRHDAAALEVLPKRPSVAQCVATWRFLAELLALAPGDLASLHETHFWPMSKCEVCDTAAM